MPPRVSSYHASRESFTYLREFYIGELWPEERQKIPMEQGAPPRPFAPPGSQRAAGTRPAAALLTTPSILAAWRAEVASDDFMAQLRDFAAAFRLSEESQLAFVKAHLGA